MKSRRRILVIIGHPDPDSYCGAVARAYAEGASAGGAEVRLLDLSATEFEPILKYGYRRRTELEPELLEAQHLIRWADHLVFAYPTWWGFMPALLKGFVDRVFLPGFAFKYRDGSPFWDRLLAGKTARLLVTTDTPPWYNRLVNRRAGYLVMSRNILRFCGISPVGIAEFGPIRHSSDARRARWLDKARKLGTRLA